MNADKFIGTGKNPNPNVPDLPLGFGMELAQNPKAADAFGHLTDEQKTAIINRIQSSATGKQAKDSIVREINELSKQ